MLITLPRIITLSLITTLLSFFLSGALVAQKMNVPNIIPTYSNISINKPKPRLSPRTPLPDFSHIYNTQEKKQRFFSYLNPIVNQANAMVLAERNNIKFIQQKPSFNAEDKKYLEKRAKKYRVKALPSNHSAFFNDLLSRVDEIPPSLVLAQAANESAWGTSRFAIKGNNLFGQWCFSRGCGLVPAQRTEGASHEVAKFDSVYNSVESYILNLNRHSQYAELRSIRLQLQLNQQTVTGIQLANGLIGYSERGQDYVDEIQSMIRFNNLLSLDNKPTQ